jgi:hypothetical protein
MMIGNIELTLRGRLLWLAGAMLIGLASQYCINYGICAAPISG